MVVLVAVLELLVMRVVLVVALLVVEHRLQGHQGKVTTGLLVAQLQVAILHQVVAVVVQVLQEQLELLELAVLAGRVHLPLLVEVQ
jgi:hypothetical protein